VNSTDVITGTWKGKSDYATSTYTAYLQIYNQNSGTWETLDSDNETGADTEFTLTGAQTTDVSNYYAASNWVSFRVYQVVS